MIKIKTELTKRRKENVYAVSVHVCVVFLRPCMNDIVVLPLHEHDECVTSQFNSIQTSPKANPPIRFTVSTTRKKKVYQENVRTQLCKDT